MTNPTIEQVAAAVRSIVMVGSNGSTRGRDRSPEGRVAASRPSEPIFAGRLLSFRNVEDLPPGTREVRVAPGTVITPLARDLLKRRAISLRMASRADAEALANPGEWGFATESESGLVAALRRAWLDDPLPWVELPPASEDAADWVAERPDRGALVLTDEASVAVWGACQRPGIRAAAAMDVDAVSRSVRRLGVNLLAVEPAGKSISLMRQLAREFRSAGAPRPPVELERRGSR